MATKKELVGQQETPLALVDRDGTIWPWDGNHPTEYMLATGVRYLYSKQELKEAQADYVKRIDARDNNRRTNFRGLDATPEEREAINAKQAMRDLGMSANATDVS